MWNSYTKLGVSLAISYVVMFVLTMSMIDQFDHFYLNASNAWMALIMVAPMGVIMILVMWKMFDRTALNIGLLAAFVGLFVLALVLGRQGVGVGDQQFLTSMIPHHSRAILVCQESDITDPRIQDLCDRIIEAQRDEIAEMEGYLADY